MAEPFDWLVPKRNPDVARGQKARREGMYRTELEERAGLLHRLGHPREAVRTRLLANLKWDFPDGGSPVSAPDVDAIVERAFGGPARPGRGKPATK
jgi:hypothetical protein